MRSSSKCGKSEAADDSPSSASSSLAGNAAECREKAPSTAFGQKERGSEVAAGRGEGIGSGAFPEEGDRDRSGGKVPARPTPEKGEAAATAAKSDNVRREESDAGARVCSPSPVRQSPSPPAFAVNKSEGKDGAAAAAAKDEKADRVKENETDSSPSLAPDIDGVFKPTATAADESPGQTISLQQITAAVLPTVVQSFQSSALQSSATSIHTAAAGPMAGVVPLPLPLQVHGALAPAQPPPPPPPQDRSEAAVSIPAPVQAAPIGSPVVAPTSEIPTTTADNTKAPPRRCCSDLVASPSYGSNPAARAAQPSARIQGRPRSNSLPDPPAPNGVNLLPSAPPVAPAAAAAPPPPPPMAPTLPTALPPPPVVVAAPQSTKPPLRRGKWTAEEEAYVARVIQEFNSGYLHAPAGATLRTYLSEKLHCDPMRITKKFTGDACIGKRVFHPAVRCASNAAAIDRARSELDALERRWRRRLEMQQKESAKKAAAVAASAAAAAASAASSSSSGGGGGGRHHLHVSASRHPQPQPSGEVLKAPAAVAQGVTVPQGVAAATGKEQIVTQTATWLERANAILAGGAAPCPHSTYQGGQPGQALPMQPVAVESQMKEVRQLIHEGPTIQQSTAGLPRLLQGSSLASSHETPIAAGGDEETSAGSARYPAQTQAAPSADSPGNSKRKVSADQEPSPSTQLPTASLGASAPTMPAPPPAAPSGAPAPFAYTHYPQPGGSPPNGAGYEDGAGPKEQEDKRPRRSSPPPPPPATTEGAPGPADDASAMAAAGAAEGAEALVGFLNSVRAQSYKQAAAASSSSAGSGHLSG